LVAELQRLGSAQLILDSCEQVLHPHKGSQTTWALSVQEQKLGIVGRREPGALTVTSTSAVPPGRASVVSFTVICGVVALTG